MEEETAESVNVAKNHEKGGVYMDPAKFMESELVYQFNLILFDGDIFLLLNLSAAGFLRERKLQHTIIKRCMEIFLP